MSEPTVIEMRPCESCLGAGYLKESNGTLRACSACLGTPGLKRKPAMFPKSGPVKPAPIPMLPNEVDACPQCFGSGTDDTGHGECLTCEGTGSKDKTSMPNCDRCYGRGCYVCNYTGQANFVEDADDYHYNPYQRNYVSAKDIVPAKPVADPKILMAMEQQYISYKWDYNAATMDVFEMAIDKPQLVVPQRDGLYLVIDRPFARFVNRIKDIELPGLTTGLGPSYKLKIPPLPGLLYGQIVNFFRHFVVAKNITGATEVFVQVYWDAEAKEYFLNVPKQVVSSAAVQYDASISLQPERVRKSTSYKVFDIHSHNTMSAFFSMTDDNDEKGNQFFGVVGNITDKTHDHAFRMGTDGVHASITPEHVIDMSTYNEFAEWPREWLDNVALNDSVYSGAAWTQSARTYTHGIWDRTNSPVTPTPHVSYLQDSEVGLSNSDYSAENFVDGNPTRRELEYLITLLYQTHRRKSLLKVIEKIEALWKAKKLPKRDDFQIQQPPFGYGD